MLFQYHIDFKVDKMEVYFCTVLHLHLKTVLGVQCSHPVFNVPCHSVSELSLK